MRAALISIAFLAGPVWTGALSAQEPATRTSAAAAAEREWDLVVYGGTSGGVAAAVQAARMERSAVLIEPGGHLGGLSSSGLGATDIGERRAIGGLSREFYRRIKAWYQQEDAWTHQRREEFRGFEPDEDAMWLFEPHVAERVFAELVEAAGVPVVFGARLARGAGAVMGGARLEAIALESGQLVRGRMFVDATYEGDLLAAAGVTYTVGRESNATYDETLNGVQKKNALKHQLAPGVDPWLVPGSPRSGLLPGVHGGEPGEDGEGDRRVQAYNFRLCLTDVPQNRLPFEQPEGYDPLRYELLLRNFEAGEAQLPWNSRHMPNRKTDTNNNRGFSTDAIGLNHAYPEADYDERARIVAEHERYQRGLLWTLVSNSRVPEPVRQEAARWGLAKDEFVATGGWPHQIYVREARRMVGEYVVTEHDCMHRREVPDPVGLGAYNMDSHNVQRYVDERGHARNEGDVQVPPAGPYPISYRALLPRRAECENLLVPVCLSASHIAYGSIRMEPVFMILGQAAGTAACLAVEQDVALHDLPYERLGARLAADGARLDWRPPVPSSVGVPPSELPGLVVDDPAATLQGTWTPSTSAPPFVGSGYLHGGEPGGAERSARFDLPLEQGGRYELRLAYSHHANRASEVRIVVRHANGLDFQRVDQRAEPPIDGLWTSLGTYQLERGAAAVTVSSRGADGFVVADAVQALPAR